MQHVCRYESFYWNQNGDVTFATVPFEYHASKRSGEACAEAWRDLDLTQETFEMSFSSVIKSMHGEDPSNA